MSLICCNIRMTETQSGARVRHRSGHHQSESWGQRQRNSGGRTRRIPDIDTTGTFQGGIVLTAGTRNTAGMQSPGRDCGPPESDHDPGGPVPTSPCRIRSHQLRRTDTNPLERTGDSPMHSQDRMDTRGDMTGNRRHDTGCMGILVGSPRFDDAASKCPILSRTDSPTSPLAAGGQRTEISRIPGHFRVGLNSVERLDCSTSDGHTTQTRQLSDERSKMPCTFNRLSGIALKEILPHIQENGEIGLRDLQAFTQLLEAAFGDPDRVATAERAMRDTKQ